MKKQLTVNTIDSVKSLFEYVVQQDDREWQDFAENIHCNHVLLHGLNVAVQFLGWGEQEIKESFTELANDGDHYDEMMTAWNDFQGREITK